MGVRITSVEKHSPANKAHIKSEDILLKINGHEIHDVLDYMFYVAEDKIEVTYLHNGKEKTALIQKGEYDDLGLNFSNFLMDEKQSCKNKCVFCFIDQMPPGMRDTLYFKDDDERLSFLHGNYVTLTNLKDEDIQRIIDMRLNINVSVHTTNPELRVRMMNNRFAGEKLKYLKMLADANVMINCQIVLCPGLNDGYELERTLSDLGELHPSVVSIAVVPVGLSKFRDNLYPLEGFTKETAGCALEIIKSKQDEFYNKYGTRLVYPADEFFLKAERDIPDNEYYEDYSQYENGVGLIRVLKDEFDEAVKNTEYDLNRRNISLATGVAAYNLIAELIEKVEKKWHNLNSNVYVIKNNFFGENITVAGLITGKDLVEQLKDKELGDVLIIPSVMLKADSDVFLDDYTVTQIEDELGVKILPVANEGNELLEALLGI